MVMTLCLAGCASLPFSSASGGDNPSNDATDSQTSQPAESSQQSASNDSEATSILNTANASIAAITKVDVTRYKDSIQSSNLLVRENVDKASNISFVQTPNAELLMTPTHCYAPAGGTWYQSDMVDDGTSAAQVSNVLSGWQKFSLDPSAVSQKDDAQFNNTMCYVFSGKTSSGQAEEIYISKNDMTYAGLIQTSSSGTRYIITLAYTAPVITDQMKNGLQATQSGLNDVNQVLKNETSAATEAMAS